jgi:hypothetical protein
LVTDFPHEIPPLLSAAAAATFFFVSVLPSIPLVVSPILQPPESKDFVLGTGPERLLSWCCRCVTRAPSPWASTPCRASSPPAPYSSPSSPPQSLPSPSHSRPSIPTQAHGPCHFPLLTLSVYLLVGEHNCHFDVGSGLFLNLLVVCQKLVTCSGTDNKLYICTRCSGMPKNCISFPPSSAAGALHCPIQCFHSYY